jgi:hypothetical protein
MGKQLQLFKDDRPEAKPRHRPHQCRVCRRATKRKDYCSRSCRMAAHDLGYARRVL